MMRLPPFRYAAPATAAEVARLLHAEGPAARVVAGGTDLLPNMKRRHQSAATLVSLKRVADVRGIAWEKDGSVSLGAGETLRAVERDAGVQAVLPALAEAVRSISTPLLRNMGTLGGNVCLDTRCNYYNQNWEWRRAINFCMKCDGDTCWVAPSSPRCWAVNSSDSVPVLIALGARVRLVGPAGTREIPAEALFKNDGIDYLTKAPDEVLTHVLVPAQHGARSVYRKVRRRGAFDFPVLGAAVRVRMDGPVVAAADVVLNAVGSTPVVALEAQQALVGKPLTDEVIAAAAERSARLAKPLDNTDHLHTWRKKMVAVEVRRALTSLRGA
jgi:4-hydroxybenzoyl-CoA reductase subunit beta